MGWLGTRIMCASGMTCFILNEISSKLCMYAYCHWDIHILLQQYDWTILEGVIRHSVLAGTSVFYGWILGFFLQNNIMMQKLEFLYVFFRICPKTEIFIKQMEDSVHYRYAILNIFHSQGTLLFFWNRFYLKHSKA